MIKYLLYFDESGYNSKVERLNNSIEKFQELLNENNNLGLFTVKSIDDLIHLAESGDVLIKKRLEESMEPTKILGIPVSRKKAIELLELPDFSQLNQIAAQCRPYLYDAKDLSIDKSHVVLTARKIEDLRESFSFFARTEDQKELAEAHMAACEALSKLNKCLKAAVGIELRREDSLSRFFSLKDGSIIPSEPFYRSIRSQMHKIANQ